MRSRFFLLLSFFCVFSSLSGADFYDIEVGGIYYKLNQNSKEAIVINGCKAGNYFVQQPNSFKSYSGDVVIPESFDYNGITFAVTSIAGRIESLDGVGSYGAFEYCDGMTSIFIPRSIKKIGNNAFNGCTSLNAVYISDLSAWCNTNIYAEDRRGYCPGTNPLYYAHNLYLNGERITELIIPEDITEIKDYVFIGCNMTSALLHKKVKKIGGYSFDFCNELKDLYILSAGISLHNYLPIASDLSHTVLHIRKRFENYFTIYDNNYDKDWWKQFLRMEYIEGIDFNLVYKVDGDTVKSYILAVGDNVPVVAEPTKKGYTFSWLSEIPETMPDHDVTIEGTFSINKYKLTYKVDDKLYKESEVEYDKEIVPEADPKRKGMTFSGWSQIPSNMPDRDVVITGRFNWSKVTIDNVIYQVTDTIDNQATATGKKDASGEVKIASSVDFDENYIVNSIAGKAFYERKGVTSIEIPSTLATIGERAFANIDKLNDVYCYAEEVPNTDRTAFENSYIEDYVTLHVIGASIDKYKATAPWKNFKEIVAIPGTEKTYTLTYTVDGETYKTVEVKEGEAITPEEEPTKEGYTFSGWGGIPDTMPSEDVTVVGSFTVNKYTITYYVDGEVYKSVEVEYGATITPEDEPTKDGYVFSGWSWMPSKMPAEDVTISGTFKQIGYNVSDNIYVIEGNEATFAMTNVTSGDLTISPTIIVNNITYNVTAVAGYSCMNNTGITSVTIPDGVTVIGDNAFYGCTGVKSLSLGKDIGYIGNMAFAYIGTSASARKRASSEPLVIECHAESVPDVQNDSFEGIDMGNAILKVDDDLVDSYKNVYPWSQFTNIVGFNAPTDINSIYSEDNGSSIFSIDGRRIDKPQKGMNIIRTSQGTRKVMVK